MIRAKLPWLFLALAVASPLAECELLHSEGRASELL